MATKTHAPLHKLLPVWNLPAGEPFAPGSRDPLGFQRYAGHFAEQLLPNLTVLTTRARYYAFLAWVLDEMAADAEPRLLVGEAITVDEYNETLARFERYLALAEAAYHEDTGDSKCSWIGLRKSLSLARDHKRATLPLYIPLTLQEGSNGVLADYRQSLLGLNWLADSPGAFADLLSEEGQALADCFRRAIKMSRAGRIRDKCFDLHVTSVTFDELSKDGGWLCLSEITKDEAAILRPKLLGGNHADIVAELKPLLKRHNLLEADVYREYLPSSAKQSTAFELKRVALYQVFAIACLGLLAGIQRALSTGPNGQSLGDLIARQMKTESIPAAASLQSIARGVNWEEEVEQLAARDDASQAAWLKPSLRLLSWVSRFVGDQPGIVLPDAIDSVSLGQAVQLFQQSARRADEPAVLMGNRLINDHQRVFRSKLKKPWLTSSGGLLQLAEDSPNPPLGFPPNSVRINSLISIYRDLQVSHA